MAPTLRSQKLSGKENVIRKLFPKTKKGIWLTLVGSNPSTLIDYIRKGVDFEIIDEIKLGLSFTTKEIADNLNLSIKTLDRRKTKHELLSPVETEKIFRLIKIINKALAVFEDLEYTKKWMKEPNPYLNGYSPISLCDNEVGGEEVLDLLGRIEHGVFA